MNRRDFLWKNVLTLAGASLAAAESAGAAETPAGEPDNLQNTLSRGVQMQFMRPGQVEAAGRKFPVVYVPFGLIEWHGRHLPLGNDAIKAHAFLVKCAEKFGGVVYPPVFFHGGFSREHIEPVIAALFNRLKKMGFRVIMAVSGHFGKAQFEMINAALAPALADGTAAGIGGITEVTLAKGPECSGDHAAKWETSNMMFFYPDLVDLSQLGDGPINLDQKPPSGIGGLDPRKYASAEVGRRNVELAIEALGRKAQELLASLPEDQRSFNIKELSPEHWWSI